MTLKQVVSLRMKGLELIDVSRFYLISIVDIWRDQEISLVWKLGIAEKIKIKEIAI